VLTLIGGIIFLAAQGGVIFLTALLVSDLFDVESNFGKLGCMAISYIAWVAFTWGLFAIILKPDVWLLPAMGALTAIASSFVYLMIWLVLSARGDNQAAEQKPTAAER
jgi:hypothetical protein